MPNVADGNGRGVNDLEPPVNAIARAQALWRTHITFGPSVSNAGAKEATQSQFARDLSSDAASGEMGSSPLYMARVRLDRESMNVDGKSVHLVPGMAATVEIKTGRRRLINFNFILSPLRRMAEEAGRER